MFKTMINAVFSLFSAPNKATNGAKNEATDRASDAATLIALAERLNNIFQGGSRKITLASIKKRVESLKNKDKIKYKDKELENKKYSDVSKDFKSRYSGTDIEGLFDIIDTLINKCSSAEDEEILEYVTNEFVSQLISKCDSICKTTNQKIVGVVNEPVKEAFKTVITELRKNNTILDLSKKYWWEQLEYLETCIPGPSIVDIADFLKKIISEKVKLAPHRIHAIKCAFMKSMSTKKFTDFSNIEEVPTIREHEWPPRGAGMFHAGMFNYYMKKYGITWDDVLKLSK